ncbi:MAG: phosphoribosyltransferase [Acidimicrobiales bacterium]
MFADRAEAGQALVEKLKNLPCLADPAASPLVVALPRGGVPVGFQVARSFAAPLVVMPVAKIGAPGREELAVGALAPGGALVLNDEVVAYLQLGPGDLEALVSRATAKVAHQLEVYGMGNVAALLSGRLVVIVDDGLATGASMKAALLAVRQAGPVRVVMAVPVAPPEVLSALACQADDTVCALCPENMRAVGAWYEDFTQTTDAEVAHLLAEARTWCRAN